MVCHICNNLYFSIICKKCQKEHLQFRLQKRYISKDFFTYTFYDLSRIDYLIKSKYLDIGSAIFKVLAKNSLSKFAKEFKYSCYAVGIDNSISKGYSHSAILTKSLNSRYIKPLYNSLEITNSHIKYSGKSKKYREDNRREFNYSGKKSIDVILVDDVITTGLTLIEAKKSLEVYNINVLFAIVLADSRF
jgi:competence protein ComFC